MFEGLEITFDNNPKQFFMSLLNYILWFNVTLTKSWTLLMDVTKKKAKSNPFECQMHKKDIKNELSFIKGSWESTPVLPIDLFISLHKYD